MTLPSVSHAILSRNKNKHTIHITQVQTVASTTNGRKKVVGDCGKVLGQFTGVGEKQTFPKEKDITKPTPSSSMKAAIQLTVEKVKKVVQFVC